MKPRRMLRRTAGSCALASWPNQRMQLTREGLGYLVIWLVLFFLGLQRQINLILLTVGLAVGPIVGSVFVSAAMLWKLRATRLRRVTRSSARCWRSITR